VSQPTLFYLAHCEQALCDNLVAANMEQVTLLFSIACCTEDIEIFVPLVAL
jgi:hypothetical protein